MITCKECRWGRRSVIDDLHRGGIICVCKETPIEGVHYKFDFACVYAEKKVTAEECLSQLLEASKPFLKYNEHHGRRKDFAVLNKAYDKCTEFLKAKEKP